MNFDMASLLIGFFVGVLVMLFVYTRSRGAAYEAEIGELNQKLTTAEASLAESQEAASVAQKEAKTASRDLKKAQKALEKSEQAAASLSETQARVGELEGQLADCQAKAADLETALDAATVEPEPEPEPAPQLGTLSVNASEPEPEPEIEIPREPKPKDLQLVEGIGPKISELLIEAGIYDLADLAEAAVDKLQAVLEAAGSRYKLADPSTWSEQAALGAKGDMEGMKKLQDELKGGRRAE